MFTLKMIQKRMLIECCLRIAQFYQKFNITEEKNLVTPQVKQVLYPIK